MKRSYATALMLAVCVTSTGAQAKDLSVKVDARSAPWSTGVNAKMRFGMGDARAPKVVIDPALRAGVLVTFAARGTTTTAMGGQTFGPRGDLSWPQDRGMALFPSHYITSKEPVFLNELVGAFISADGVVVGQPFAIGESASVRVPEGASALALGLNDDRFSDNVGTIMVDIHIPEASVIVESRDDAR